MMAWALFCHDFDLSKGINILSEKCPVVLDHYTRHTSGTGVPASACFKIAMIWLSVNRDCFMQNLLRIDYEKIPLNAALI